VVYLAHDPAIGRPVAIKLIRTDLLDSVDHEQYLVRFRAEASNAGRCIHPNVVSIYDFALHDGNPYLAMEYIDGVGLGEKLKRAGRFAPADAVALIVQVLGGLDAAHRLGVVHRDVKPANILVLPNGTVKMTDFGISRIDTSDMTMNGAVIGTPAYMSPEQCRGETVDHRSDLFSTGAVLYELLSGVRAFSGRSASEVSFLVLCKDPPDVTDQVADVPEPLAAALRKSMEKHRDARFASAQEMAEALREAIRGAGQQAAGTSSDDRTITSSARAVPTAAVTSRLEQSAANAFDDTTLSTIERRLALHLGPIARHLVRNAARQSTSVDTLCQNLARAIEDTNERERFLAEMRRALLAHGDSAATGEIARSHVTTGRRTLPAVSIPREEIDRLERALIKQIGPIARLLVKRAASRGGSENELWEQLAKHIENPADRESFLMARRRP
jgi:eukaryotic-like serine/threonine-protein kinase